MSLWEYLWSFVWWTFTIFIWVAALMILIWIIIDIFRDRDLHVGLKVVWLILIFFLPLLGAIIYVIARGKGMAERQVQAVQQAKSDTDSYIREVAGKSPAEHIADAKALLDAGTIDQNEFNQLKAKALA